MKTSILYILIAVQAGILSCMLSCVHVGPTTRKVAENLDAPPVVLINEGALQLFKKGKFFIIILIYYYFTDAFEQLIKQQVTPWSFRIWAKISKDFL